MLFSFVHILAVLSLLAAPALAAYVPQAQAPFVNDCFYVCAQHDMRGHGLKSTVGTSAAGRLSCEYTHKALIAHKRMCVYDVYGNVEEDKDKHFCPPPEKMCQEL